MNKGLTIFIWCKMKRKRWWEGNCLGLGFALWTRALAFQEHLYLLPWLSVHFPSQTSDLSPELQFKFQGGPLEAVNDWRLRGCMGTSCPACCSPLGFVRFVCQESRPNGERHWMGSPWFCVVSLSWHRTPCLLGSTCVESLCWFTAETPVTTGRVGGSPQEHCGVLRLNDRGIVNQSGALCVRRSYVLPSHTSHLGPGCPLPPEASVSPNISLFPILCEPQY